MRTHNPTRMGAKGKNIVFSSYPRMSNTPLFVFDSYSNEFNLICVCSNEKTTEGEEWISVTGIN